MRTHRMKTVVGRMLSTTDRKEKIMTTIETPSVFRHLWKSMLALGVLTLALGVVVLVWPGRSILVAGVLSARLQSADAGQRSFTVV